MKPKTRNIPQNVQNGVLYPQIAKREDPIIGPVVKPSPAPVSRYPIILITFSGYKELMIDKEVACIIPVDNPRVTQESKNK